VDGRIGVTPVGGVGRRDVDPGRAVGADLHLLAAAERSIAAGYGQRGVVGDEVRRRRSGIVRYRGDRHCRRWRRGVDCDGLAGGAADVAGGVHHPRLIGEARVVDGRVGIAPVRGVGRRDVEPGRAVGADLHLLAAAEHAIAAGYRQRGIAGDEVCRRRPGVGGHRVDRHCRRGRRGIDRDGLAGGAADVAGDVHHPRLIGKARIVDSRVGVAPVRGVGRRDVDPGRAVGADLHLPRRCRVRHCCRIPSAWYRW